ncbi:ABC transporter ATP-binding protein [Trinickia violacea]|uniref:ABC transporter ATP-binding protein n=2 Tax=Trinickia violacea TaxID=2571746 RepID=A0A4P8IQ40_9BURK|nr:ABC transporter ATP-binding protein [Trinickia violacea]
MRNLLQTAWTHTLARLASLSLARPRPIQLEVSCAHTWRYIGTAIGACAPTSTLVMVAATMLGAMCHLGQSYVLGGLTEQALLGHAQQVTLMLVTLIAFWMVAPLLQALNSLALLYSSQNLRIGVTDHLTTRLMHARPAALAESAVGNLVERVELASNSLQSVVGSVTEMIVKLASVTLLATLVLLGVSTPLALTAGIWMLTALLFSSYMAYTGMNIVEDASDAHAKVIAELAEIVTNVPLIRSFLAQLSERERFGGELRKDLYACRRVRSYWVFVLLIETAYKWLFGVLVAGYTAHQYSQGQLSLPQLITVCSLIISLSWHFESVAFHFVDLFDALGVLRSSLRELSAIPVDIAPNAFAPRLSMPGRVMMSQVCTSYGTTPVLRNVSLCIEPGMKVGIVGPSGSGKSTLLAVLRGDVTPDSGDVELHGVPISSLSSTDLHSAASEAQQSALMFNRSVLENVAYGPQSASSDAITRALTLAQARALVDGLANGSDTLVGERGAALSTGERQRLSIARALLKNTPLLIFDEATSSVDAISEARILEHLVNEMPRRTVIVVSHRVATLNRFDLVLIMDHGQIVDTGTPCELMKRSSLYRHLLQSDPEEPAQAASVDRSLSHGAEA